MEKDLSMHRRKSRNKPMMFTHVFIFLFLLIRAFRTDTNPITCLHGDEFILTFIGRNKSLPGNPYLTTDGTSLQNCHQKCLYEPKCWSINTLKITDQHYSCKFFNITRADNNARLVDEIGNNYYEVDMCYPCRRIISQSHGCICDCRKQKPSKEDCLEWLKSGFKNSGIYKLNNAGKEYEVFCDMQLDGGGWIKFQNRYNGSVDFYRTWEEYKKGFGTLDTEFWLGNELVHILTKTSNQELVFVGTSFQLETRYAYYSGFNLGSEEDKYRFQYKYYEPGKSHDNVFITFNPYLVWQNNSLFSTIDSDNDDYSGSCVTYFGGPWWSGSCHSINFNGRYFQTEDAAVGQGIHWFNWYTNKSLKASSIMFRKK